MFFLSAGLIVAVTSERLKHRHTKLIALGEQRCITVDMDKGGDVRTANEGKLVHVVAPFAVLLKKESEASYCFQLMMRALDTHLYGFPALPPHCLKSSTVRL